MRALFSSLSRRLKLKRVPVAPCDCGDYISAVPEAPSLDHLRTVVGSRQSPAQTSSLEEAQRREHAVRTVLFDLKYRCGGAGRCTCTGAPACRFPACFTMRPTIKGAEVQAARAEFELEEAPTPAARALVVLARQEQLQDVIGGIQRLVSSELQVAAGGRSLNTCLVVDGELEFTPNAKLGPESAQSGANPLLESEELRQRIVALYLWRAALLVNTGADEAAVFSLVNLASAIPQEHRTPLYAAAAGWAVLNDMEVIYYRSVSRQYHSFQHAERMAHERSLLLGRVYEAMRHDNYHMEYCAHVVFSKEVSAIISRAQAAQMYDDFTEDPMKSLCVPLSLPYYRFKVHDVFWNHFLKLLCMPPMPPQTADAADPVTELAMTPSHILDAVGRSMLLHHLVMYSDSRDKDINSGAIADRVAKLQKAGSTPSPLDYDRVLDGKQTGIAVTRMQQLLVVAKGLTEGGRIVDDSMGSGKARLPQNAAGQ